MQYTPLKLWLSLLGLVLMVSGFLIQQATKTRFIQCLLSPASFSAKIAFENLRVQSADFPRNLGFEGDTNSTALDQLPSIIETASGFNALSVLLFKTRRDNDSTCRIVRFLDACSVVPDKRGEVNLVLVEWADGVVSNSSYEEIGELIEKKLDSVITPLKYLLFFIGLAVAITMFFLTYFIEDSNPPTNG